MTTTHRHKPRRRLDVAGLVLLLTGIMFGVLACWLIESEGYPVLIIIPSIIAGTLGASNLTDFS